MTRFAEFASRRTGRSFDDYGQLYEWSVTEIEQFWELLWEYSGIIHSKKHSAVLESRTMPGAKWFIGARLNFAENLLRYRDDHPAIIGLREASTAVARLTYAELYSEVARCAEGLRWLGVGPGDRVAAYLPNIPEAIVAMLAATALGAVWSSCSPDFGLQGVLERFSQIGPKVLIVADRYQYHGKQHESLARGKQIAAAIASVEALVVVASRAGPALKRWAAGDEATADGTAGVEMDDRSEPFPSAGRVRPRTRLIHWAQLLDNAAAEIRFEQQPFDQPVYIMYSSGTTGAPKCIVHGAGGTLLQHYKEHALHTNIRRDDVVAYYTTCGWMMWNWLASVLQIGATIVLYDGSPVWPEVGALWRVAEAERITVHGTSPKYIAACRDDGLAPGRQYDLSSLKTVRATGSPLTAEQFDWVHDRVGADLQLSSISGGTDIISCFMLGNPNVPVYAGEIQCRGLGMKVEVFDDRGQAVAGEIGELVCTAPCPSMPVGFWNDADGSKYRRAYFERYPGVWWHGDYIRVTENGGVVVYGRSDATLNPGGVRIGTAEIYGPVEAMPEVADSIVVGQKWQGDTRVVLFVVLAQGLTLDDDLRHRISRVIRESASPRHVPARIVQVQEIPHTLNGKKVEIAVTRMIHGEVAPNRDALTNPHSLDQFRNLPELGQ
jgi:acetoacetyl-CoA synthetase